MVWRYDHDGGDLEAFFRRLALHTAMDGKGNPGFPEVFGVRCPWTEH